MANGFTVKNMPATLSGYKAHVYCEDTDQVNIAWNRVKVECDAFGWGAKVADDGFFEVIRPGHKQWGKGVTIYFPQRATWKSDLDYLVRLMAGRPESVQKGIEGDTYAGNGVSWRYEFHSDPGYDILPEDVHSWYKAASTLDDALEDLSKILSEPVSIPNADGSYGYMGNWEAPTYDGYDWATHLRGVREVYRGVGIPLSPEDQEWFANGGNRGSTEQTAEYVLSLVEKHRSPGVGLHWTSHRGEAAGFAGMTADRGGLRVILTAQTPSADQVMTGDELKGQGFFGPSDGEQEVPVKKGTPMRITKVEWAPGGPRPMMRSDDGGGWMGASPNGTKTVMASKTSALDNEARISVAEQVMERAGLAGDVILVPVGRVGDEAYESSMEPLRMWVRDLCRTNINFYASDYILDTDGGGAQALTDGMNRIVVRPITNTMTILHEVAHVLNRSSEGRGHDDQFITTLEGLYRKHLGAEAADTFIDLVRPD